MLVHANFCYEIDDVEIVGKKCKSLEHIQGVYKRTYIKSPMEFDFTMNLSSAINVSDVKK
jgi:hypothetical protein